MSPVAELDLSREGILATLPMPLTLRPPVLMTDDELIAFSRRNKPYRVERNARGEIEIMSPTGGEGSHAEAIAVGDLLLWTRQHGGISFSSSGGFTLPDTSVLSPDAAWVSSARWSALSREDRRRYPPICPEFVIEVLSASDSRPSLERKMHLWITNGAQLAWMIDPFQATVSIFRPHREPEVLTRPDSMTAGEPIEGFCLRTAELWSD